MRSFFVFLSVLLSTASLTLASERNSTLEELRQAYEAKMLEKSFLDIEEMAKTDKQVAGYVKYLNKKGITNSAHFEQYKVRIRVESLQKDRPRRWSETGHSHSRANDPYVEEKLPKGEPLLPEAKERW